MSRRIWTTAVVTAIACIGSLPPPLDAAAQTPATATIRVVHGVRGLVADVYVDGELALPTFQPERATDPITLPSGEHLIEVRTAGAATTETPLLTQTVSLAAGSTGSMVAHLDGDGEPALTVFADDLSPVPAGQARLVVRHTAAAGPVDVSIDEAPSASDLAPGQEAARTIAPGSHRIASTAASGDVAGPPEQLAVDEGTVQFVYLIGAAADDTLAWAVVEVAGLETAPAQVPTGDGSVLGIDDGGLAVVVAGSGLALVLIALGALTMRASRHRA